MFTYEKFEDCPDSYHIYEQKHYKITFDDGFVMTLCLVEGQFIGRRGADFNFKMFEAFLKNSPETTDIAEPCNEDNLLPNAIANIELLYIINNIFDVEIIKNKCGLCSTDFVLDYSYSVRYFNDHYSYYEGVQGDHMFGMENFKDIYQTIEFLRKEYSHLLKPVKLAINRE